MAKWQVSLEGVEMRTDFWRNKKVLITGHTGFKGSWLSLWLQLKAANVIGYSLRPPTEPSLFEKARVSEGMISIDGDVRDLEKVTAVFQEHKPEIVIHMAAQSLVRYSYENPVETYATNVMGTLNVLEAVRKTDSAKAVLIITSDKCYENMEWPWGYREVEPMGGFDPYSSSKGCAELLTAAYRNSYFLTKESVGHGAAVASARAGNVIGGGDWALDRLIPDIMRAIVNKETVVIRNPHAIRPWQHVLEPLNGYMCLIEKLWEDGVTFGEGWNFGPKDEDCKPVSWIVSQLDELWKSGIQWQLDTGSNPHEAAFLKLDCSKAKNLLKWEPKLNLPLALEYVVEWYEGDMLHKDLRGITENQIAKYESIKD